VQNSPLHTQADYTQLMVHLRGCEHRGQSDGSDRSDMTSKLCSTWLPAAPGKQDTAVQQVALQISIDQHPVGLEVASCCLGCKPSDVMLCNCSKGTAASESTSA
jgi:hypothetical protein